MTRPCRKGSVFALICGEIAAFTARESHAPPLQCQKENMWNRPINRNFAVSLFEETFLKSPLWRGAERRSRSGVAPAETRAIFREQATPLSASLTFPLERQCCQLKKPLVKMTKKFLKIWLKYHLTFSNSLQNWQEFILRFWGGTDEKTFDFSADNSETSRNDLQQFL